MQGAIMYFSRHQCPKRIRHREVEAIGVATHLRRFTAQLDKQFGCLEISRREGLSLLLGNSNRYAHIVKSNID